MPPREAMGHVWRHFWLSQLGRAPGIWWVEAGDVAKHPIIHKTAPNPQRSFSPQVSAVPRLRIPDFSEKTNFLSRWEGPLLAVAGLEASGCSQNPLEEAFLFRGGWSVGQQALLPLQERLRMGECFLVLSGLQQKVLLQVSGCVRGSPGPQGRGGQGRCHYVSLSLQVPRAGEDSPGISRST